MTALDLTLYVLGAAGTLPAIRSLLRDQAARVYYPTWAIAVAGTVFVVMWPLFTVAGVARLAWRWRRP